ncbi:MAG: hypothetical protein V1917_03680 [Candidatus Gottesmanbacteria bacterium]
MELFTAIKTHWILVRESWNILSKNRIISLAIHGGIVFCIVSLICIAVIWTKLPPLVPLWYSKPWGIERLAHPLWLLLLPSSSLFITGVNVYITSVLINEYLVFSQILSLSSFVVSLLSTMTLIKIIFMVM